VSKKKMWACLLQLAGIASLAVACASGPEKSAWRSTKKSTAEFDAERYLLERFNRERQAAGLPALSWNPRAGVMASVYSLELREKSAPEGAPVSTSTDELVRVTRVRGAAELQSIAPTRDLDEVNLWLMNSAEGRAVLLSSSATEVGIGIHFGDDATGRDKTFIAVLVRTPPDAHVARTDAAPAGADAAPAGAEAAPADGASPPASPGQQAHQVSPMMLEGARIAGSAAIVPSDATKLAIQESGLTKVIGSFYLCITVEGIIAKVERLKSTGFPLYDLKIMQEMKSWRYRPYQLDGKPVPVCTAVTFVYSQK